MYVEREIREKFEKIFNVYPIVAIVGPRQAGKTTFLKEHAKLKNSSYLLFDDPDIKDLFDEDIKKFENQNIESYDISVLDEVQYCKDAGQKLKYLADKKRKLWITSSSEIILSKEVLSYLVGRVSVLRLYPFSITEFMKFKGQKELNEKILKRIISEHIAFGGYPKVVITSDNEMKQIILRDLYETMILKDIAKTFSIEDIKTLQDVVRYLSFNIGGLITYENISKDIKISFQSLRKYLDAMEKSYLITRVTPFFSNKTKEIIKQSKIYFIDTGLRNIISKDIDSKLDGKIFENYVASELIKLGFTLKYWRTKTKLEVDFIIEEGKEIIPVEVKLKSQKIPKGMLFFIDFYKPKRAFVVVYEGDKKELVVKGCKIKFVDVMGLRDELKK